MATFSSEDHPMAHGAHGSFGLPKHEIDPTADDAELKIGRKRQMIGILVRPTVSPFIA